MKSVDLYNVYKRAAIGFIVAAILVLAAVTGHKLLTKDINNTQGVVEYERGEIEKSESLVVAQNKTDLNFATTASDSDYIWVPMPEGITAADVAIENHYMDRQLWILVNSTESDFYKKANISGNLTDISGGSVSVAEEKIILKLDINHVYEYSTIFEDGVLYIEKIQPYAQNDKIVIIDPAGLSADIPLQADSMTPNQICVDIASKLKGMLEEKGIKVYVTKLDDVEVTDTDCLLLLNEVKPDMYVRIETSANEDSKVYGTQTIYNGTYFIPGFGSTELADLLESNVTTSIGGKADGLMEASELDTVILKATVPAASVKVGYYTNMQENILLNRDDYRTKIAQGMFNAIMTGFGEE